MRSLSTIPVAKYRYFEAFSDVLLDAGAPVERLLERSKLSPWVLEDPERLVSEVAIWRFVGLGTHEQGMFELGARVGERCASGVADSFRPILEQEPSAVAAIRRFGELARRVSNTSNFFVTETAKGVRFHRQPPDLGDRIASDQMEAGVLQVMIEVARLALGRPEWRPRRVFLQAKELHGLEEVEALRSARFVFGAGSTAFDIDPEALVTRVRCRPGEGKADEVLAALDSAAASTEWLPAFRQLVGAHFGHDVPSLWRVAGELGTSVRTLQRALAAQGTSFSRVLEEERIARARDAIAGEARPITEIGLSLGYADPAHFTRAFRRWFGMSPTAFRRLATAAEAATG